MKKCKNCGSKTEDYTQLCPQCGEYDFEAVPEDSETPPEPLFNDTQQDTMVSDAIPQRQKNGLIEKFVPGIEPKAKRKLIFAFAVTFLLGFLLHVWIGIKPYEYQQLEAQKTSVEQERDSLTEQLSQKTTEFESYKTKMQPYEELQQADLDARLAEVAAQKAAEQEAARKKSEEEARQEAEQEAKGYETGITYDQLARTPDNYKYSKVKFKGKVVQVIEGSTDTQIRLAVNGDYDSILFCSIPKAKTSSMRILENDYITIMGVSNGLISYKSTMGGTITIPSVSVNDWGPN